MRRGFEDCYQIIKKELVDIKPVLSKMQDNDILNSEFTNELFFTSLEYIKLIVSVEKRINIKIPDDLLLIKREKKVKEIVEDIVALQDKKAETKIKTEILNFLKEEYYLENVNERGSLTNDYGIDSLGMLKLIIYIEEKNGIIIPDEELGAMEEFSVQELISCFLKFF